MLLSGASLFCLLLASSNRVLAQDAFNGADDATYVDWLEAADYSRHIFLPGPTPEDGAAIHWSITTDQIKLAVAVRATGWSAFGISENGGMRGADMIIFQADGEELIDAHVLQELFPVPDACQSWTLRNSVANEGFLIFEASRYLDTGDSQDRALFDDSSLLVAANRVVAAWGDTPTYSYHGPNRARGSLRFFGDDEGDELATFATNMAAEAEGSFDIRANNFAIPRRATTYQNFCFLETDLAAMGMPTNAPLHFIGIQPIVDERATPHIHHFIVYGSQNPNDCNGQEVAFGWASGDLPSILPSNVGGPLGTNGFRAFRIQIHYNNPSRVADVLDSSGVRFFWTSQKREYDSGVFQTGDPMINLSGRLVGDGFTAHEFLCRSECSAASLSQPVTVLSESLHMHISGRRMTNEQIRGTEVVRVGTADYFDYEQQGTQNIVQEPFTIEPGDSFRTKCYFESNGERFGLASQDEMCIAFITYYPRQLILNQFPFTCGAGYEFGSFNQCNADWTRADLSSIADLERNFGALPSVCASAPAAFQSFGCFSGSSTVYVKDLGSTSMRDVKLGDKILVEAGQYEAIYSFGHFNPDSTGQFVEIVTEASKLQVSRQHLLFLEDGSSILASQVSVNHRLLDASGSPVRVKAAKLVQSVGVFAPFTKSGKLVVDGILASSYISLEESSTSLNIAGGFSIDFHWLAHASKFPHRFACQYLPINCNTEVYTRDAGVSVWVDLPLRWSQWLLRENTAIRTLLLTVCVAALAILALAEVLLLHSVSFLLLLILASQVRRSPYSPSIKTC